MSSSLLATANKMKTTCIWFFIIVKIYKSNEFKPKNSSIYKSVYIYILIFIGFIIPIICIMISYGMILIRLRSSIKTNIRYGANGHLHKKWVQSKADDPAESRRS